MFGRQQQSRHRDTGSVSRRHGRRPIRSSLTGAHLADPQSRVSQFEFVARSALDLMRQELGDELQGVHVGFATAPTPAAGGQSEHPMYYTIDRANHTIVLFRMPIQRAKGLHVDDVEHRQYFIGHCVHRAVCEYLGKEPWEVAPGRFDHF